MEGNLAQGRRILLVDDEQLVRRTLKLLLGFEKHTVVEAGDGAEGLELFRQGPFDLVITDLDMPRMRGDKLAAKIKELAPEQPVIMITAHQRDLQTPIDHADIILEKPFSNTALREALAKLLKTDR